MSTVKSAGFDLDSVLDKIENLRRNSHRLGFEEKLRLAGEIVDACEAGAPETAVRGERAAAAEASLAYGRKFLAQWELDLENLYSGQAAPGGHSEVIQQARGKYVDLYRAIVKTELALCRPTPATRVCHVGCGGMPLSAFLWHKYSGATVTGLDCEAVAVERARAAFADRLAADPGSYDANRVSFIEADGAALSYRDFDVVVLSSTVRGKAAIFSRIAATAPEGVVVIERIPGGFWRKLASWEASRYEEFAPTAAEKVGILEIRRLSRKGVR